MSKRNGKRSDDPICAGLEEIKRLLMFGLLKNGATQADLARALGVNQSTVSKTFPKAIRGKRRQK
jgi:Mn-dependent DtxR family transcriptional regulator